MEMDNQGAHSAKKNRESSIRWQGRTIEQFGYILNLVLGLSVAGIGYEINLILNDTNIGRECWQSSFLAISLLLLVISVCAALWCVLTRLRDFRITAEIARQRENGISDLKLQPMRIKSKSFGDISWILLCWQIISFAVGVLFLVVVVMGSLFA